MERECLSLTSKLETESSLNKLYEGVARDLKEEQERNERSKYVIIIEYEKFRVLILEESRIS